MTIQEIQEQLQNESESLAEAQRELESVLDQIPEAKTSREAVYNSKVIEVILRATKNNEKPPTDSVKTVMAEQACEELTLALRILELRREGLKSRLEVISTRISVLQTQARLLTEELAMSRYGRSNTA